MRTSKMEYYTGPVDPGSSPPGISRAAAILRLMRPLNCAIAAIGVFAACYVAVGVSLFSTVTTITDLVLGILTVFLITAGGNAINDVIDLESDKINHPSRPLPSGHLTRATASQFAFIMFILGGLLAVFISAFVLLITVLAIALLLGYELAFKHRGLPGNLTVSMLTALVFVFGGAIGGTLQGILITGILGLCAFFATLGREVVKDVEDLAGDVDRDTLPKQYGVPVANGTALGALIAGVCISPLPWYPLNALTYLYLIIVFAADAVFIAAAVDLFRHPHRAQQIIKLAMVIALVAFILGR